MWGFNWSPLFQGMLRNGIRIFLQNQVEHDESLKLTGNQRSPLFFYMKRKTNCLTMAALFRVSLGRVLHSQAISPPHYKYAIIFLWHKFHVLSSWAPLCVAIQHHVLLTFLPSMVHYPVKWNTSLQLIDVFLYDLKFAQWTSVHCKTNLHGLFMFKGLCDWFSFS